MRSVANKIEGLLDDDGQFNPNPDQLSRGHPDYDHDSDPRNEPQERDERGRFKAAEASDEETDLTDVIDDDQAVETGDDSDEDTEQFAGDTDEDQTTSAIDEAETGEQETEGDIQNLSQLAEALDITLDDLKAGLTHTFKAADEDVTVTLAELEAGYQKDADYRRQTGQLAEARRQAEADYQGRMQAYEQQNVFLAQNFELSEQLLAAELNDPRLATLRESDPAEWTARREEVGQRLNAIRQARQNAAQRFEAFRQQQRAETKQREQSALAERIPEFGPQHVQLARGAMESLGYSGDEIAEIFDHRLVIGALELVALRSEVESLRGEKAKAQDTVKRVKKDVPKLQKPGKQRTKSGARIKRDNVARLKQRAAKSGKVEDAARVIEQMI